MRTDINGSLKKDFMMIIVVPIMAAEVFVMIIVVPLIYRKLFVMEMGVQESQKKVL